MIEAVFRHAFPDTSAKEEMITGLRKGVIQERLGFGDASARNIRQSILRDLSHFGYDKTMMRTLSRERTVPELNLFIGHSSKLFHEDVGRAAEVPWNLGQNPALDGTLFAGGFNRATMMLDEDLHAIDQAVAAVTGKPPRSEGRAK
jgi:hypothetical protein